MSLLRTSWKLLVGIKDALTLLFLLLFFGALYAALSFTPNPGGEARGGALLLDIDGVLVEQTTPLDPLAILSGASAPVPETASRDVIRALREARADDDIKAIVLDLDGFLGGGAVTLGDVAAELAATRKAGKPILTHATGYSDDAYALAAHASEIWLDPMGGIVFAGSGGSQPYFKGLLDRFDVTLHVFRVGKFKSYVEPYLLQAASPEARAADQTLADTLWGEWKAAVKAARPKADIETLANDPLGTIQGAGGDMAKAALARGLVDKLGTAEDFAARVSALSGHDNDLGPDEFNHSSLMAYLAARPLDTSGEPVAVIHVSGEIVDGEGGSGMAGGDSVAAQIDAALNDLDAKALVLRIDSPGGSVTASERIRQAALHAKKQKVPVIVSMGNVAASGGYWIAMAGDKVFAEPATVTGSIGVFGVLPTFENTLSRYGVTSDGVRTTPLSGQPDPIGGLNDTTGALFQLGVEDIYRRFITLVAEQRKMPLARVEEVAQGRVWPGGLARQQGLVDAFGSLDDAVAEATKRAGLAAEDVSVIHVGGKSSFLERLFGPMAQSYAWQKSGLAAPRGDMVSRLVALRQAQAGAALLDARNVLTGPAVQVRCIQCPATRFASPKITTWFNRDYN